MNTPILTQSEEEIAPWNMKKIEVTVSQTLSSTQEIEVPENFDVKNIDALEKIVAEQITLPSDCIEIIESGWVEDDFCVI